MERSQEVVSKSMEIGGAEQKDQQDFAKNTASAPEIAIAGAEKSAIDGSLAADSIIKRVESNAAVSEHVGATVSKSALEIGGAKQEDQQDFAKNSASPPEIAIAGAEKSPAVSEQVAATVSESLEKEAGANQAAKESASDSEIKKVSSDPAVSVEIGGSTSDSAIKGVGSADTNSVSIGEELGEQQAAEEAQEGAQAQAVEEVEEGAQAEAQPAEEGEEGEAQGAEEVEAQAIFNKTLSISDVGKDGRLILPRGFIENHENVPIEIKNSVRNGELVEIVLRDEDTQTEHPVILRRRSNGQIAFQMGWKKEFVVRRGLQSGNNIGIFWNGNGFTFRVND